MKRKKYFILQCLFLGICILAFCFKMLFFGLSPDEEYQITMSYRLSQGDGIFMKSWDTIQTSGFLNMLLIRLYLFSGTSQGIVIFLRAMGLLFQAIVSGVLFFVLRKRMDIRKALPIACISFFTCIKTFISPDFSNMMVWFLNLTLCLLWFAADKYQRHETTSVLSICIAAFFFSGAVLVQANILIVPVMALLIHSLFPQKRKSVQVCFWSTCFILGIAYCSCILIHNGVDRTIMAIQNTLAGDLTHAADTNLLGENVFLSNIIDFAKIAILLFLISAIAWFGSFILKKRITLFERVDLFWIIMEILSIVYTLWNWFIIRTGYDGIKLYIPVTIMLGIYYYRREKGSKQIDIDRLVPRFGVYLGLAVFINVLFISNVKVQNNLSVLLFSTLWGVVLFGLCSRDSTFQFTIFLICGVTLTGSVLTLQSSPAGCTIFDCDGKISTGAAMGTRLNKDIAYAYNLAIDEFRRNVPEGASVLLATTYYGNKLLYYCYFENNVNISHYSVNSTPSYFGKLKDYWLEYPDLYPSVIVTNQEYWNLPEFSWMREFVENEFMYETKIDEMITSYYR